MFLNNIYNLILREHILVLENINIQILEGEIVTILGKSGCGKSTLLNLIAGFENSYGGEILLNGKPVTGYQS